MNTVNSGIREDFHRQDSDSPWRISPSSNLRTIASVADFSLSEHDWPALSQPSVPVSLSAIEQSNNIEIKASIQPLDDWSIWSSPTSMGLYSFFADKDRVFSTKSGWSNLDHVENTCAPPNSTPITRINTQFTALKFGSSISWTSHIRKTGKRNIPNKSTSSKTVTHTADSMCKSNVQNAKYNMVPQTCRQVKCKTVSGVPTGNDYTWKNIFDVLGLMCDDTNECTCTSTDGEISEVDKPIPKSNNKYKFTKKQIKYIKKAKRSNFAIKLNKELKDN